MIEEEILQEEILQESSMYFMREEVKREGYILWVAMQGEMTLSECYELAFQDITDYRTKRN